MYQSTMGSTYCTGLVFVSNIITANLELIVIAGAKMLIPIYSNLIFSYSILRVHTMEKDYIHTKLTNNVPV